MGAWVACVVWILTHINLPPPTKHKTHNPQILKEDCERNELRVREIRGEIELMQSLNHPNIVQVGPFARLSPVVSPVGRSSVTPNQATTMTAPRSRGGPRGTDPSFTCISPDPTNQHQPNARNNQTKKKQYIASGQEPRTFVVMERLEGGSLNQRLGFAPTHSGA